jgi:16S rRNA (guanine966-N2)-methyltransferase
VRPTAEAVRDAWLKSLQPYVDGARVVDLFAGSGALGIEALSRGAKWVDFVETRPSSLHALRANVAAFRLRERARIYKRDALVHVSRLQPGAYDVAFADPPYGSRMLDRLIQLWSETRFAAVLSVEHAPDHLLPPGGRRHLFDTTAITTYSLGS